MKKEPCKTIGAKLFVVLSNKVDTIFENTLEKPNKIYWDYGLDQTPWNSFQLSSLMTLNNKPNPLIKTSVIYMFLLSQKNGSDTNKWIQIQR